MVGCDRTGREGAGRNVREACDFADLLRSQHLAWHTRMTCWDAGRGKGDGLGVAAMLKIIGDGTSDEEGRDDRDGATLTLGQLEHGGAAATTRTATMRVRVTCLRTQAAMSVPNRMEVCAARQPAERLRHGPQHKAVGDERTQAAGEAQVPVAPRIGREVAARDERPRRRGERRLMKITWCRRRLNPEARTPEPSTSV